MSNGKGMTPKKGYNDKKYRANYDAIFKKPSCWICEYPLQQIKTEVDGEQTGWCDSCQKRVTIEKEL